MTAWLLALLIPPLLRAQPYTPSPDYSNPARYLAPGTQSALAEGTVARVAKEAGLRGDRGLADVGSVYNWAKREFETYSGGGSQVGRTTAAQLEASRRLSGCHDWGLLISAVLRSLGYPAIMVEAAGIDWARRSRAGTADSFTGHVFIELFVSGRWILLDSTNGRFLDGYDPSEPVVPMPVYTEKSGFYVLYKGVDPAGYGITDIRKLNDSMLAFARDLGNLDLRAPDYRLMRLPVTAKRPQGGLRPLSSFSTQGGAQTSASYSAGSAARTQQLRPTPTPQEAPAAPRVPQMVSEADVTGPCRLDPSRIGRVVQFRGDGLDVHAEKSGAQYLAHRYPFGQVFRGPSDTVAFGSLDELNHYLGTLSR